MLSVNNWLNRDSVLRRLRQGHVYVIGPTGLVKELAAASSQDGERTSVGAVASESESASDSESKGHLHVQVQNLLASVLRELLAETAIH